MSNLHPIFEQILKPYMPKEKGFHARYCANGSIIKGDPVHHIVDNDSLKSLCGRNARDWFKLDDGLEIDNAYLCNKCRKNLANH